MERANPNRLPLTEVDAERAKAIGLAKSVDQMRFRRIAFYKPHPKQTEFHNLGAHKRSRLFMAGNQQGKTIAGGFEVACHLTGLYPPWWQGYRFERNTRWWVGGQNGTKVRDNPQMKLLGPRSLWGTGFIPASHIMGEPAMSKGTTGLVDFVEIGHVKGGRSLLKFMSYDMSPDAWESDTLHGIWYDEEPDREKYSAGLARLTTTAGIDFMTFTPMNGMSDVVRLFYPNPTTPERGFIRAGLKDALHISPDRHEALLRQYPFHERQARAEGIPILGSGQVYDVPEDAIRIEPFQHPPHWPELIGLDLGGGQDPTAFVRGAWDRDSDVIYLTNCYKVPDPRISTHAAALIRQGRWIPVAWPHDAHVHERAGDGESYSGLFRKLGVNMLPSHAVFPEGGYQVEPGIAIVHDRLSTGRMRVFSHLWDWFEEYRLYHRKDGKIAKSYDHLMDATRLLCMMIRYARTSPARGRAVTTVGMDYDPLRGR